MTDPLAEDAVTRTSPEDPPPAGAAPPASPPAPPPGNPYARFAQGGPEIEAQRPTLGERFTAHEISANVRGTILGAARQLGDTAIERAARERGKVADLENEVINRAVQTREDLARYDAMPDAEGFLERGAAVLGALYGGVKTPESLIGNVVSLPALAARGLLGRIAVTGANQAIIAAASDVGAQGINLATPGGIRKEFDPTSPFLSAAGGFVIGAGLHGLVEGAALFVKPTLEKDVLSVLKAARDGGETAEQAFPDIIAAVRGKSDDELAEFAHEIAAPVPPPRRAGVEQAEPVATSLPERDPAAPWPSERPAQPEAFDLARWRESFKDWRRAAAGKTEGEQARELDQLLREAGAPKVEPLSEERSVEQILKEIQDALGLWEQEAAPRMTLDQAQVDGAARNWLKDSGGDPNKAIDAFNELVGEKVGKDFSDAVVAKIQEFADQAKSGTAPAAIDPDILSAAEHWLGKSSGDPVAAEAALHDFAKTIGVPPEKEQAVAAAIHELGKGAEKPVAPPESATSWLDLVKGAKQPKSAGAAPPVPPKFAASGETATADVWTKVGGQKGSNKGGVYEDAKGVGWYVKVPKTADHASNEVLANRLYALAGADVPEVKATTLEGAPAVASKWLVDYGQMEKLGDLISPTAAALAEKELRKNFAADAWLGNWDVIGLKRDNILVGPSGPVRIDQGGGLRYRAKGEPKEFGPQVKEWETLRDPKINPAAAAVFSKMTKKEQRDSINRVLLVTPEQIADAVEKVYPAALDETGAGTMLLDTLIKRQEHLREIRKTLLTPEEKAKEAAAAQSQTPPAAAFVALTFAKASPEPKHELTFTNAKAAKHWAHVGGQSKAVANKEPPLPTGTKVSSGAIIVEPDGRVWLMKPVGEYGGYKHTFPKGQIEEGLSPQANAIKEAFEETGLKVKITKLLGDYQGDTGVTRYYMAERVGGSPMKHGGEAEAVILAPHVDLLSFLNKERDIKIAKDVWGNKLKPASVVSLPGKTAAPAHTYAFPEHKVEAATKLGFNLPAYAGDNPLVARLSKIWLHGTTSSFDRFKLEFAGKQWGQKKEKAVFLTPETKVAKAAAHEQILPLVTRVKKVLEVGDPDATQPYSGALFAQKIAEGHKGGYDAVLFYNTKDFGGVAADQLAVLKPNLIRSIHAEFSAKQKASSKLAAMKLDTPADDFDAAYEAMLRQAIDDQVAAAPPHMTGAAELRPLRVEPAVLPIGEELAAAAEGVRPMAVRSLEGSAPKILPPPGAQPSGARVKAPNLRKLWQTLAADLDAVVRQGRMRLKGAAGEYSEAAGVVRLKQIDDPVVLAHELGHHLKTTRPELDAAVAAHEPELSTITKYAADQATPEARREEGFAEFLRLFVENSAEAKARAPGFDAEFRQFLNGDTQQKLKAALETAQQGFEAYRTARGADIVDANVHSAALPTGWEKLREDVRDRGIVDTIAARGSAAYAAIIDQTNPLAKAVRGLVRLAKEKDGALIDLPAADDPYKLIRLARLAYQGGHVDLANGVIPWHGSGPEGPSLFEAIALATGKPNILSGWDAEAVKSFGGYLTARRAIFEWERRAAGLLDRDPTPLPKEHYQDKIAVYEAENPHASDAADMVHQWTRNLLRKEYEAGLLTREQYEAALAIRDYVPFMRDMTDLTGDRTGGGAGGVALEQDAGLRRFRGSARPIINPLESLMERAFRTAELVAHNDAIRALANLADLAGTGAGRIVERVPAKEVRTSHVDPLDVLKRAAKDAGLSPEDADTLLKATHDVLSADGRPVGPTAIFRSDTARARGENIVFFWEGGELQALRLASGDAGRELVDILTGGLPTQIRDWNLMGLGLAAKALRFGVTASPEFFIANSIRDQVVAWVLNGGTLPFIDAARGVQQALVKSELAAVYSAHGGIAGGANTSALNEARVRRSLQELAQKGFNVSRLASWEALFKAVEFSETGTRLGIFERAYVAAKKQGMTDYQAAVEATFRAVDYIDFGRHGSRMAATISLIPFFNANVQGVDKAARSLIAPLFRETLTKADAAARTAALVSWTKISTLTGLTMALRALYIDDPEYDEISDYLRNTHWMIKVPGLKSGKVVGVTGETRDASPGMKGLWLAIPKPFEMAVSMNLGERAVEILHGRDPKALFTWASGALALLGVDRGIWENPGLKLWYEVRAGKNFYTGRDIVPERLKGLEPWLQATAGTSAFSQALATKLDEVSKAVTGKPSAVSPMVLDHIVRGATGSMGRSLLALSDQAFGGSRERELNQTPVAMRFFKESYQGSTSTARFWEAIGRENGDLTRAANTYDALLKAGTPSQAADYAAKLEPGARIYVTLAKSPLDDAREELRRINKREKLFNPYELSGDAVIRRAHPMERAGLAIRAINQMTDEIARGRLTGAADGEPIALSPSEQRTALDILSRVRMWEARSATIITGRPGTKGLRDADPATELAILEGVVPAVHAELAQRYANAKVYRLDAVRAAYPALAREVIERGSAADLARLVADIAAEGYELGGTREKAKRIRPPIAGRPEPAAAAP